MAYTLSSWLTLKKLCWIFSTIHPTLCSWRSLWSKPPLPSGFLLDSVNGQHLRRSEDRERSQGIYPPGSFPTVGSGCISVTSPFQATVSYSCSSHQIPAETPSSSAFRPKRGEYFPPQLNLRCFTMLVPFNPALTFIDSYFTEHSSALAVEGELRILIETFPLC